MASTCLLRLPFQQGGTYDDDYTDAITKTVDGNVVAAGYTAGSLFITNDGSFDIAAAKLSVDNGEEIWTYQVGQT